MSIGTGSMGWIQLTQDSVQDQAVVNMVMRLRIP
jgi:hypothetical protein